MKTLKTYFFALVLLVSVTFFIACDEDDDTHSHEPTQVTSTAVEIIASGQSFSEDPSDTWQDAIQLDKTCLLTINANANADYNGNVRNAGIILTIKLNGEEIASDFSFEGESASVPFSSSASTTIFLQPGNYDIEVERFDIGVNGNYKLRVNYHAVYAEMSN